MKLSLTIIFILIAGNIFSQKPILTDSLKLSKPTPEIFTSGFIDVMNNGQVNAAARFVRLSIGEPGKFSIPLCIYGGVSNNTFNGQQGSTTSIQKSNDQLINQYINPLSGLINVSIDGITYFSNSKKITKTGFMYQIGERVLTGYKTGPASNPQTGRPSNFLNGFGTIGLYFQTGAWERNNAKNVGIFWMAARYIATHSSSKSINEFLPDVETNGLYHGYSLGFGVEINNLINIKAIFYRYVKKPEIEYYLPIYQFTFNYAFKNQ